MFFRKKFVPWNKGKTVGQKRPFTIEQANQIKQQLERRNKLRDLALFSVAFDTMLRGVDLLTLTVSDVQDTNGLIRSEFCLRQRKTGNGILVGLTPSTQRVVKRWVDQSGLMPDGFLFARSRGAANAPITTDQYRKLVKSWVRAIGLDPRDYSTHSLRRTKASMVYGDSKDYEAVRRLLGHQDLSSTIAYLNMDHQTALTLARKYEL